MSTASVLGTGDSVVTEGAVCPHFLELRVNERMICKHC